MKPFLSFLVVCIILFAYSPNSWAQKSLRVVSLAPSLTKNIQFLDAENLLAGCTSYCKPSTKVEIVASAVTVNIEKVITLKPDLVVATTITKPETIEKLRKLGIRVEVYPTARSFDDICTQFIKLGDVLDKKNKAETIINETKKQIEQLQQKVPKQQNQPRMFIQIGANPLYSVYPGLFMNDYMEMSKTQNIAADLTTGSITREAVVLRNPDVIFVVTMGIVGDEEKRNWEKLKQINAVKNNKIFIIDSDLACTPTPITYVKTLETIINLTYSK
jgi:ABC-type Fe3+-hydroxamate transport system substrate-binding protein